MHKQRTIVSEGEQENRKFSTAGALFRYFIKPLEINSKIH